MNIDNIDTSLSNIELESFDTWTVVKDKEKLLTTEEKHVISEDVQDIEIVNDSDDKSHNSESEDLSDGISIISECEGGGRISPHPELAKQLTELNDHFADKKQSSIIIQNSAEDSNSPFYEGGSEQSSEIILKTDTHAENNKKLRKLSRQALNSSNSRNSSPNKPSWNIGLRGLFYIGAFFGVLALISKLRYELVPATETSEPCQQKNDLEMKNNKMQIEIEMLTRQVNYLMTLNENLKYTKPFKQQNNPPKEKKIKVWSGNGDVIEEVVIDTKDLKKPYKCDDENLEIAGICVRMPKEQQNILDSVGDKVRLVLDKNNQFAKVESEMGNPTGERGENSSSDSQDDDGKRFKEQNYTPHEHKPEKYDKYDKKYNKKSDTYERKKQETNQKHVKYDTKKSDNKRENYKKHKNEDSSENKERYQRDRSNENINSSGEKYKKSKDHKKSDKYSSSEYEKSNRGYDDQWRIGVYFKKDRKADSSESEERYYRDRSNEGFVGSGEKYKKSKDYKKHDKYSSSEYEKAKRELDGQWHEKLMQHRENSRKNNERGDSREQARNSEEKYRFK